MVLNLTPSGELHHLALIEVQGACSQYIKDKICKVMKTNLAGEIVKFRHCKSMVCVKCSWNTGGNVSHYVSYTSDFAILLWCLIGIWGTNPVCSPCTVYFSFYFYLSNAFSAHPLFFKMYLLLNVCSNLLVRVVAECWLAWCNLTNTMKADGLGWNPAVPGSVSGVLKAAGVTVEHRSAHISHQPSPLWLLVCCQWLMLRNHCRSQENTIIEGGNPEILVPALCVLQCV